jgi:hypothetical protein
VAGSDVARSDPRSKLMVVRGVTRWNSTCKLCAEGLFSAAALGFCGGARHHVLLHDIQAITHFCFLMSKQNSTRFQYLRYRRALLSDLDRDSGTGMLASRVSFKL